jgi:hypothetical protein
VRSHPRASSAGPSTRKAIGLGRIFAVRGRPRGADGSGASFCRLAAAFFAAMCALGLLAAPAGAALPTHAELPALGQSGFERVCGLAVDSAGNRYVADFKDRMVRVYSPSGAEVTSFTPSANNLEEGHGPCGLAVDSQGNLYVNGRITDVVKYKPSSFPPTASTTYAPDTSVNANGVLVAEEARGVAVDPATDNVYVAFVGHISSYEPDGTPISETIGEAALPAAFFSGLAVRGSTGRIYVTESVESAKAYVLSPDGTKVLTEVDGSTTQAGGFSGTSHGVAVDQSNGHFYVTDIGPAEGGNRVVDEFDSGGELVSELPSSPTLKDALPSAIAVDNSGGENDGDVFFSAGLSPSSVFAFGPLTYAKLFDLKVTKAGPGQGTVTSEPTGIDCGSACEVSFKEGTDVTLIATPAAGSSFASWEGCDTATGNECTLTISTDRKAKVKFNAKPSIKSESVRPGVISALLEATVNPNGEETSYQFEYLTEDAYQANGESFSGPEEANKVPASPESIGGDYEGVGVSAELQGLAAHTAYRFRVVASNQLGMADGEALAFITYLPPQVLEPCANDEFRIGAAAHLPDCRAYEQATPVAKNGGDLTGDLNSVHASDDGKRISFMTYQPIPGAEGGQTFIPLYLASRGASAWSTQGLLPPQNLGVEALVAAWTPDFTHVFEWGRFRGEPNTTGLFDRNTVTGAVRTIVPHTAGFVEPEVPGSSDDGSVVIFSYLGSALTSGAAPNHTNLYIWGAETRTYRLGGVFNDGKAPPGGALAGAGDTFPRGAYTHDQRALSADGKILYFTAGGTEQLYMRVNPAEPQSLMDEGECIEPDRACTYQVSEPQRPVKGPDPAGPQHTHFRAASADGKVAYFTSSEMLTDDANTGAEQQPAQIGRAKIGASGIEEEKRDFLPAHAVGVTTYGGYIYWADPTDGTIGRARLDGSEPPNPNFIEIGPTEFELHPFKEPGVLQQVPSRPRYVAVNSEYVYWTNTGATGLEEDRQGDIDNRPADNSGTIGRAKLGPDGPETPEPEFITGASNPQGIALDAGHLYWTHNRIHGDPDLVEGIGRATLEGEGANEDYCAGADFEIRSGNILEGLAIEGGTAYLGAINNPEFVGGHESVIAKVDLASCHGSSSSAGRGNVAGVMVEGPYVYWVINGISEDGELGRGKIGRMPLAEVGAGCFGGPICEKDFANLDGTLGGLASDGEHLYWSANGEGSVNPGSDLYRYEADAAVPLTDVTPDAGEENGAEVIGVLGSSTDGSYVYFAANGVLADGASPGDCPLHSCNLYVYHDGVTTFIGEIFGRWNWSPQALRSGAGEYKTSRVSADGSTVLFSSSEGLIRYRYGKPGVLCVSCNPTGVPSLHAPSLSSIEPLSGFLNANPGGVLLRNLSADGNRVFFETPDALVLGDTNGDEGCPTTNRAPVCQDVYEWEAKGAGSCESEEEDGGCLYLISTGKSKEPSFLADASANGNDVFFFTREHLSSVDKDSFLDVYDAKVGGGLASQNQSPPPPPCEGEACKDGANLGPESGSPVTPLFSGPGNPKAHHKKPKSRKHKHRRKSHKHRRHAKNNGRAHR